MDEPTAVLSPVTPVMLSELIAGQGPLQILDGVKLAGAMAGVLQRMHASGKVHGRLTPDLVQVQWVERGPPVVVFAEARDTLDMSEAADLYALGALTFYALSGHPPEPGEGLAAARPDVPGMLDKLVSRLLSRTPGERPAAGAVQRQLSELVAALEGTSIRPAAPLSAPPQIKRGIPIGIQPTDAHAWVQASPPPVEPEAEGTQVMDRAPSKAAPPPGDNPFAEDEATVAVSRPQPEKPPGSTPKYVMAGPAMEDEPTVFTAPKKVSQPSARRTTAPKTEKNEPVEPETARQAMEPFEPSRSDLPGSTGEHDVEPVPLRRRRKPSTKGHELFAMLGRQPPWVWGAVGVGLAFFVLLLIALTR